MAGTFQSLNDDMPELLCSSVTASGARGRWSPHGTTTRADAAECMFYGTSRVEDGSRPAVLSDRNPLPASIVLRCRDGKIMPDARRRSSVMKVIIAGGGIGGLTTALMLHARGIEAEIYEQADAVRELGVGINTLPHAIKELAELGLLERLDAVGIRTHELIYANCFGQE